MRSAGNNVHFKLWNLCSWHWSPKNKHGGVWKSPYDILS